MDKFTAIITNGLTLLAKKIDSLVSEVKQQKPIINVAPPKVEVNLKDIVIPKFPAPIVNVNVPDVIFDASKIPAPIVNVPAPNITVEPTKVEFPKEMSIVGMDKLLESVSRETDIFDEISSKKPLPIIVMGKDGKQVTDFGGEMTAPSTVGLRVGTTKVSSSDPLPVAEGLSIPAFDYVSVTYTSNNPTTIIYKTGGSGGTTVATLNCQYSGSNIISITKT